MGRQEAWSLTFSPLGQIYSFLLPGCQSLPEHRLLGKTSGDSSLVFVTIVTE